MKIMEYKVEKDTVSKMTVTNKRFESLKTESQKWQGGWQQMSTYIDPTRGIFEGDRTSIGEPIDHETLVDSHASHAKETTASGLQTGTSDPSRPWFKLAIDDFTSEAYPTVKAWLDEVQKRMIYVLQKSNIYDVLYSCYEELVQFGTGCFIILEDEDDVIRGRSFTCGEYFLGVNSKGRVNAFAREFEMTCGQMVEMFGLESVSDKVKACFENKQIDQIFKVRHLIEENKIYDNSKIDYKNMKYKSCYWEVGNNGEQFLAERGFKSFRIIAPRWKTVTTEMIYGYGPGWHAIGDIKELQATHKDMLSAQEKLHRPPLQKDASVQGHIHDIPGGITTVSGNAPNAGARPLYEVNPNLESFIMSIDRLHKSIDRFFFSDLFLMINSMDDMGANPQKTAFEIAERKAEKMMMLGPILHKLSEELHDKLIEIVFEIMFDNGLFPEIPGELEGQEIRIQHVSILAQAQRAIGIGQIERLMGFVGNVSPLYPDAVDNIDIDTAIRDVADMEGVPVNIIMDREQMQKIRDQRAQQQAIAAAASTANSAADTTKKLADSQMSDPSALSGLMAGAPRG
jgi:hypothetical protein